MPTRTGRKLITLFPQHSEHLIPRDFIKSYGLNFYSWSGSRQAEITAETLFAVISGHCCLSPGIYHNMTSKILKVVEGGVKVAFILEVVATVTILGAAASHIENENQIISTYRTYRNFLKIKNFEGHSEFYPFIRLWPSSAVMQHHDFLQHE